MVVKDDNTLQQAMNLVSLTPVWYSDEHRLSLISDPSQLLSLMTSALERGSIAIVSADKAHIESWNYEIGVARKQRAIEEKKRVRRWVREHPEIVKRYFEKHGKV